MRIIGLDLSLTAPGWFWHEAGSGDSGTWIPESRGLSRMDWICRRALRLLPMDGQSLVLIEGFAFGAKGRAVYEIAGLGYIVRLALHYRGVEFIEVAPSQVKKFATGKGNAHKEIVIREVWKRWNFEARDNNEADAFVLGRIGMCLAGMDEPQTEFQRAVIRDLQKGNAA
jgi:crossover junction endodeoxyribonuclease RuvC